MPAVSNGVLAGNAGWGCECPQHGDLLVAMGPDRRHPLKAGASRAPASRLVGLDWMSPARPGLAMQVSTSRNVSFRLVLRGPTVVPVW